MVQRTEKGISPISPDEHILDAPETTIFIQLVFRDLYINDVFFIRDENLRLIDQLRVLSKCVSASR